MTTIPVVCNDDKTGCSLEPIVPLENLPFSTVSIQDNEGKIFTVTTVSSSEQFVRVAQDVGRDPRISTEDTSQSLSCLHGIALDPNFTRSQFFAIYDNHLCIGIATLIVIPYKNRASDICLKRIGDKLIAEPFSTPFYSQPGSFVIEIAMMQILPPYRHKKLGESIVKKVLLPIIDNLCTHT